MKHEFITMGMPAVVQVVDDVVSMKDMQEVVDYFSAIDDQFSLYKQDSEISRINAGEIKIGEYSKAMQNIFELCEETKKETQGYFDILHNNVLDPSGLVKGYAIAHAAKLLQDKGFENIYVEIGGDIQVFGRDERHENWNIGIRNPFDVHEIIKVVHLANAGIATSGTAERGTHIYNPVDGNISDEVVSVTVVADSVYDADRYATAVFAMGLKGVEWIDGLRGYEAYAVTKDKKAYYTRGFTSYVS
jgi:thiamine biosynthesis lipoprotein